MAPPQWIPVAFTAGKRFYSGTDSDPDSTNKCVGIFDGITKELCKLISTNTIYYVLVQIRLWQERYEEAITWRSQATGGPNIKTLTIELGNCTGKPRGLSAKNCGMKESR